MQATRYGCTFLSPVHAVTSYALPEEVVLVAPSTLCPDEPLTLTATAVAGATYEWLRDEEVLERTTVPQFVAANTAAGTYRVRVSFPLAGCAQESEGLEIRPQVLPALRIVQEGEEWVLTTDQADAIASVTWWSVRNGQREEALTLGDPLRLVPAEDEGSYLARVQFTNGCQAEVLIILMNFTNVCGAYVHQSIISTKKCERSLPQV